jgi:hypothetical protein
MRTVTRQSQWPEGTYVVEVSGGGIDYTNPGALSKKYKGEFEEFADPREAVETAIRIAQQWQADCDRKVFIGTGSTGGMTMPFDPEPLNEETFAALRERAEEEYQEMPKCDRCGDLTGKEKWHINGDEDWGTFCSENCADNAYWESMEDEESED